MFRRKIMTLAVAGILSLAVAVPAVMADTFGGGNSDLQFASGDFSDGQISVFVGVVLGTSEGVAVSQLSILTSSYQDITCKGKGKARPGSILTQVFGTSERAIIKIDKYLATATASDTFTVTEDIQNSCTGQETLRDFTTGVSLDLHATSATTSLKSRTVTTLPDGSKEITTSKNDSRDAGGTMALLGTSYVPDFASISHNVSTDLIILPPHH